MIPFECSNVTARKSCTRINLRFLIGMVIKLIVW